MARQGPLSMGFSRQEYWSGLPCPPPGDLPNPGIELRFPTLQVDSLPSELSRKTLVYPYYMLNLAIEGNAVLIRYHIDLESVMFSERSLAPDSHNLWWGILRKGFLGGVSDKKKKE